MGNTLNYTKWTNGAVVDVYHLYSLCTSLTLPYVGPFGKLSQHYHAELEHSSLGKLIDV